MQRFLALFLFLICFVLSTKTYAASSSDSIQEPTVAAQIDAWFSPKVDVLFAILFYDPFSAIGIYDPIVRDDAGHVVVDASGKPVKAPLPLVVIWLILGAVFFTVYLGFLNFRKFKHAIELVRGKYDAPGDKGEVSHFQALATALSGTVGLGNIAGVAIAISLGGPGATFWLIVGGLLGMSTKFAECTLGVKYRRISPEGEVSGGPMYYMKYGIGKKWGRIGAYLGGGLAIISALFILGGAIGGGNMFQVNQAFSQIKGVFPVMADHSVAFGVGLAILVGIVIVGGIKSIAHVTEFMVPIMAIIYVGAALIIIGMNIDKVGDAFVLIYDGAFNPDALKGGIIGVLIIGFRRAAFSNEAGLGSASIAHSAVKTEEPVTEGVVALLEPFIDTVVICTMTALVLIFTGFYTNPQGLDGAQLTSQAFESQFSFFPYILTFSIFLFAVSTMISWSYYGVKAFEYLFGGISEKWFGTKKVAKHTFNVLFLLVTIVGASSSPAAVVDFSDGVFLILAFPNILALFILAPELKADVRHYFSRLKSGEIKKYK